MIAVRPRSGALPQAGRPVRPKWAGRASHCPTKSRRFARCGRFGWGFQRRTSMGRRSICARLFTSRVRSRGPRFSSRRWGCTRHGSTAPGSATTNSLRNGPTICRKRSTKATTSRRRCAKGVMSSPPFWATAGIAAGWGWPRICGHAGTTGLGQDLSHIFTWSWRTVKSSLSSPMRVGRCPPKVRSATTTCSTGRSTTPGANGKNGRARVSMTGLGPRQWLAAGRSSCRK